MNIPDVFAYFGRTAVKLTYVFLPQRPGFPSPRGVASFWAEKHGQVQMYKQLGCLNSSNNFEVTGRQRRSTDNRNKTSRRQRGAVAIEYLIVAAAIIAFTASTFFFLQDNVDFGLRRSAKTQTNSSAPKDFSQVSRTNQQWKPGGRTSQLWRSVVFVGAAAISLCLISFLYLRQTRKSANPESNLREVPQLVGRSPTLSHILAKRDSIQKYLRDDLFKIFVGDVPVKDFMTTELQTVQPDDGVEKIYDILETFGCRRVIVVNPQGKLLGIVSHKDLSKRTGQYARELMSTNLKTVDPNYGLSNAITIMLQQKLTCIPIVEQDKLVGVLTASDLMMILQCVLVTLYKYTMESNYSDSIPENDKPSVKAEQITN